MRIRKNVEEFVLRYQNAEIRTTISAGVCQYENGIKDVKEFLDLADQAMYEAKKSEKNKVMQALSRPAGVEGIGKAQFRAGT